MSTSKISIKNLSKEYSGIAVINNFNIEVEDKEIVAFIGKSGCGKSTLFDCICELTEYSGTIKLSGEKGYVNQKSILLPWYTLLENVNLIRKLNKLPKLTDIDFEKHLELFELRNKENSYPENLSGGEKQRAAILLNYLTNKDIWLLDEPFSSLDLITKENLYKWLKSVIKKTDKTVLIITHDVYEALYLTNKIVVLSEVGMNIKEIVLKGTSNFNKEYIMQKLNESEYENVL